MAKKQGSGGSRRGQGGVPKQNIKAARPAVPVPPHLQAAAAKSAAQKGGMKKTASGVSMAAPSVIRNIPKVYSPLYEMTNLMLPRDQKTLNAWNRHFFTTNPIVRNAITLHATYPISKFNISCEDPKVKQFFEDMFETMNFKSLLLSTALEYWKLGEAFPYLELDEDQGIWDYGFLHNPDFVRVRYSPLTRDPVFGLVPDDSLRRIAQGMSPGDASLRAQMDPQVINFVQKGMDIPLENFNMSHLKMLAADYDQRGTSLITSVYKDLMLYDKIRESQFAQADNMINPLTLVKLGDPAGNWKPSDDDIAAFQQIIEEAQYDPDFKLITHGAVNVERIGYAGSTLDVSQMWEAINRNIYTGLLAPEAILNGEGPNYSTAAIGLEVLRTRYDRFREQMSDWIERKVMEPIAKLQDFKIREGGREKYIVPKVIWNKMNLRDIDGYVANMIGLLATTEADGKISDANLFEILDVDYNEEQKRLRKEKIDRMIAMQETQILSKMTLEELRGLDADKPIKDLHPDIEAPISAETDEGGEGGLDLDIGGGGLGGGGGDFGGGEGEAPSPIEPEGGPPAGGEGAPPPPPAGEGPV